MADVAVTPVVTSGDTTARLRVAAFLHVGIFVALLSLLTFTAAPYGTAEPWWKAAFVCAVFLICIVAISETLIGGEWRIEGSSGLLLSMLALSTLALLQTISIRSGSPDAAVAALKPWNAISADPYQTRFFALQLLSLTTLLALFYRYCSTPSRISALIHLILAIAMASALFGILRQTVQHEPGFVLPRLKPGQGFGQFINKNHFALLMEMAFGLGIGMGLLSGPNRERMMVYVALLLPIWTGLVLSNSRGGVLAMLAQVMVASLLLMSSAGRDGNSVRGRAWIVRGAVVAILVAVISIGAVWVGGDRLVSSFSDVRREFTENDPRVGVTRSEIWRATWKMFMAHPVLGVGLGGYWIAITAYHDASGVSTPQEAHNDYLELLSSGGLVGLGIGIWFGVMLLRRARENLRSRERFQRSVCFGALLGITGVAVHSLFDFGLHLLANAAVFLALVMMATKRIQYRS